MGSVRSVSGLLPNTLSNATPEDMLHQEESKSVSKEKAFDPAKSDTFDAWLVQVKAVADSDKGRMIQKRRTVDVPLGEASYST